MRLAVFGLGYGGAVTATCLRTVTGVWGVHVGDVTVRSGRRAVMKPGLSELRSEVRRAERLPWWLGVQDGKGGACALGSPCAA
jgi:hypothetical protein